MSRLSRILEPEVMDAADDAADYDAMDHSEVNARFAADFLGVWAGGNPVVDVGTGTAQIPIAVCRRDDRPRIIGVDLAAAMLEFGRRNVAAAGFAGRVELRLCDAKGLPFADGEVGAVMSNSIVHHIPEPAGAVAEMARVVRPGGTIFVRDLMRPLDEETLRALVEMYAVGASDRQRQLFADSLRAALTADEVRDIVTGLGFAAETVRVTSDRHWTWSAVAR